MATSQIYQIISDPIYKKMGITSKFFEKQCGRVGTEILDKFLYIFKDDIDKSLKFTNKHLINLIGRPVCTKTITRATDKLHEMKLINKTPITFYDKNGRCKTFNSYTINWDNIFALFKSVCETFCPPLTGTPLKKELAKKDLANSTKVVLKKESLIPIEEFPIEENISIIKAKLMNDGIECDSVEHEMRKMADNYSNPAKSRIASELAKAGKKFKTSLQRFYTLFKRWILNAKTNNTPEQIKIRLNNKIEEVKEEMVKKAKEAVDPYKIESEMKYDIYGEKDEAIKDLKLKLLQLATPATYKAWFKDIIFETCFNDANFEYVFKPRTSFLKDQFNTDPRLNRILKAFKIKVAG